MTVRAVEGKKPYTGGTAIEITEDKVINLLLREANNLLHVNGDNELYCDLQLNDELRPTDDFPVGVTTGRIVEDNGWDRTGTILCAKTTSGDNVKLVYTDEGEIWIDNGTGTFKKLYLASEVDDLLSELESELKDYVDNKSTFKPYPAEFVTDGTTAQFLTSIENQDLPVGNVYLGQVSLSDMPAGVSSQAEVEVYIYPQNVAYCIMRSADVSPYIWRCSSYQYRGWEAIGGGATYTAGAGINIDQNNEISNTGVTSVNGNTGTVTVNDTKIGSSAPANPISGMVWYDTSNNVLKTYDGTQWNEVGGIQGVAWGNITGTLSDQTDLQNALDGKQDVLQAGNGITISSASQQRGRRSASTLSISVDTQVVATQTEVSGKEDKLTEGANVDIFEDPVYEIVTVNDMKGPCEQGFHVPTTTEWNNVDTAGYNLGAWSSSSNNYISRYLKLPLAGKRGNTNGVIGKVGEIGYYWTCIHGPYNGWASYEIIKTTNAFETSYDDPLGYSIRPFKDTPVTPDSSWTVLYQGSGSAGIFHNPDLGLISISSNGTTWYTIADKNIGATLIWDDGDTLSSENCGGYFQRGNNYMFPRTGSITTSSSTVDTSSYGPGNYYSSDTFITTSGSWSNPENWNLWGGVSQGISQQKVPTGETVHTIKATPTMSSSAPLEPEEGAMWYDTTNSVLKIYDGTDWQLSSPEVSLEWGEIQGTITNQTDLNTELNKKENTLTAGANVDIFEDPEYETLVVSDMQGPCQSGFRVPLNTDWQAIYDAGVSLGAWTSSNVTAFKRYLKLPFGGYIDSSGNPREFGNVGRYWSSIAYNDSYNSNSYILYVSSASITPQSYSYRSLGCSIRPLRNTPVTPDSSWTALYTGSGNAGIFHNPDLGLISISSNGTTWYTITDKNLGATDIWNDGDTPNISNCGALYQRGNNYGFSSAGGFSKSSTRVNASNYGPGNYYSGSTFIQYGGSWDSSNNKNLRGGVSQGSSSQRVPTGRTVHTIKAVPTVDSIAPADPVTGTMWYDTGNSAFKIYDGTTRQTV